MNKIRLANQLITTKTTERHLGGNPSHPRVSVGNADCDDIDAFNLSGYAGSTINVNNYFDINISRDGKTFIFI